MTIPIIASCVVSITVQCVVPTNAVLNRPRRVRLSRVNLSSKPRNTPVASRMHSSIKGLTPCPACIPNTSYSFNADILNSERSAIRCSSIGKMPRSQT